MLYKYPVYFARNSCLTARRVNESGLALYKGIYLRFQGCYTRFLKSMRSYGSFTTWLRILQIQNNIKIVLKTGNSSITLGDMFLITYDSIFLNYLLRYLLAQGNLSINCWEPVCYTQLYYIFPFKWRKLIGLKLTHLSHNGIA